MQTFHPACSPRFESRTQQPWCSFCNLMDSLPIIMLVLFAIDLFKNNKANEMKINENLEDSPCSSKICPIRHDSFG